MLATSGMKRAFSLVELMVVLSILIGFASAVIGVEVALLLDASIAGSIIVILLILLGNLFDNSQRAAWLASCASNERQIFLAHQQEATDRYGSQTLQAIDGWTWPNTLRPYLDNQDKVLICPEDDAGTAGGDFRGLRLAFQELNRNQWVSSDVRVNFSLADFSKVTAYVDLSTDVHWVKQMSQEQFDDYEAYFGGHVSGNVPSRNMNTYWTSGRYNGYEPGSNPDVFWLAVDPDALVAAGGEGNFQDYLIRVEKRSDGMVEINPMHGSSHSPEISWLVNAAGQDVMDPPGPLQFDDPRTYLLPGIPVSYGMNREVLFETGALTGGANGKILAIDYEDLLVDRATWHDWDDATGQPLFARHSNRLLNVLFLDGSIRNVPAHSIAPDFLSVEMQYWIP